MSVDLGDFKAAYLGEVDELLVLARAQSRAVEEAHRGSKPAGRSVRELFRAVHTIKGLSAMVSVEPIVEIAHPMETLLRAIDRGELSLSQLALEALDQGLTAIAQRVQQFANDRAVASAPQTLLQILQSAALGVAAPRKVSNTGLSLDPVLDQKLTPDEREQLGAANKPNERAISVTFVPSPVKATEGKNITSLRAEFSKLGTLVRVLPVQVPVSDAAPGGLSFVLIGTTELTDQALREGLSDSEVQIAELRSAASPTDDDEAIPEDHEHRRPGALRVDVRRVDETIDRLGTVLIAHARIERSVRALGERGADTRELRGLLDDSARQLRDLRASVLRVRMVPMGDVLEPLSLVVRDLSRRSSKPVHLHIEGGEAEIDKFVAEQLFPAFVHLVRNAVDHGIEDVETRRRAGKPDAANIVITCIARSSRYLEIRMSDDGRGIDRSRIAETSGIDTSDNRALLDAIAKPGFSTRAEATTTSGRGMGMDIVRRIVEEKLGGELSVESVVGAGTTFIVRAPLTIAVIETIVLRVRGEQLVTPLSSVEEIVDLTGAAITDAPGSKQRGFRLLRWRETTVTLVELGDLLGVPREKRTEVQQALIVRRGQDVVALAIDRATGQRECLIRPLTDALLRVPGISGTTDLGDGMPTLAVDIGSLSQALLSNERAA